MPSELPPVKGLDAIINSRLRLKHFEVFRQVCELHTIRKAAFATNMTQPAATKLIQELEEMFQVVLFHRNRRGMQLTPHGEALRRHISIVFSDIAHISQELRHVTQGGRGTIRLGIIPSLSPELLARCIHSLLAQHPRIRLSLQEGTTDELLESLRTNDLDIFFGRMLHADFPNDLRVTKIYTETFEIVCAQSHPLAKLHDVRWKDLAGAHWVLPALGSPLRDIAESMFTERGQLRPVVAVASSSFHQMRYVIASGQLLGVLPHSIAKAGEAGGDLAILRPKQVSKIAPISLITRGDIDHLHALLDLERIAIQTAKILMLA